MTPERLSAAELPSALPIRMLPDEEVVLTLRLSPWWTLVMYVLTLGLWEFWRRRHRIVVTNRRLVIAAGVVSKQESALPLGRIQDVHLTASPLTGGAVALSTAGGGLGVGGVSRLTRADATALADALNARIEALDSGTEAPTSMGSGRA